MIGVKTITFYVGGIAKPAGSKRGFPIRRGGVFTGRVAITDACKHTKSWQAQVKHAATEAVKEAGLTQLLEGSLKLTLVFNVSRPKNHYRTGRNASMLRDSAPPFPITKPDLLKLTRAVEDALTGIVWRDDSQVVTEHLAKRFGGLPGVSIEISEEVL